MSGADCLQWITVVLNTAGTYCTAEQLSLHFIIGNTDALVIYLRTCAGVGHTPGQWSHFDPDHRSPALLAASSLECSEDRPGGQTKGETDRVRNELTIERMETCQRQG